VEAATETAAPPVSRRRPAWLAGLVPLVVLGLAIGLFVVLDAPGLDRIGVPEEELAVERTVLNPGEIELHVRNDGADPVEVRQVIVNDAYASFTQSEEEIGRLGGATIDVRYPWIEGQAYEVMLLTSTGATIDHAIDAAVETPDADVGFYGLMALIGLYVGVIPVAIGMLWLPWVRSVDARWMRFLLAFTIGLLAFLGIDALLEGTELAGTGPESLGGAALVWLGAAGAYLVLSGVDGWLSRRREGLTEGEREPSEDDRDDPAPAVGGSSALPGRSGPGGDALAEGSGPGAGALREHSVRAAGLAASRALGYRAAFLVALGIGLHNLGEGLAIGSAYAIGSLALGAALVVGFALHNTTEGLAIVAPVARQGRANVGRLVLLGLLAGAPAVLGAWIGASAFDPSLAALMFGIGAGAIAQVIVQIAPAVKDEAGRLLHPLAAGGLLTGLVVMYATGLLISV
jgi:ZIP family zinc transporter